MALTRTDASRDRISASPNCHLAETPHHHARSGRPEDVAWSSCATASDRTLWPQSAHWCPNVPSRGRPFGRDAQHEHWSRVMANTMRGDRPRPQTGGPLFNRREWSSFQPALTSATAPSERGPRVGARALRGRLLEELSSVGARGDPARAGCGLRARPRPHRSSLHSPWRPIRDVHVRLPGCCDGLFAI